MSFLVNSFGFLCLFFLQQFKDAITLAPQFLRRCLWLFELMCALKYHTYFNTLKVSSLIFSCLTMLRLSVGFFFIKLTFIFFLIFIFYPARYFLKFLNLPIHVSHQLFEFPDIISVNITFLLHYLSFLC